MVWNYLYDGSETSFDVQLLEDIEHKNNEKVEATLQSSKDLCTAVDVSGNSLFHYAAKFNNKSVIEFLIESGSEVNLKNKDGKTPLLLATEGQSTATIKVLLKFDADIHLCDKDGINALEIALHTSPMNMEIAKLFLERLSDECLSDSAEIAKRLMKISCPLYLAVLLKNLQVIKWMLAEDCAIDAKDPDSGKTALHMAIENFDSKSVDALIAAGADVNAKDSSGKTPLATINSSAPWFIESDILKTLIKAKAEVTSCDNDGFMQVRRALRFGSFDTLDQVLESRMFNVEVTDQHKQNAIHYLAGNTLDYTTYIVKKKVDMKKIDVNVRDENGLTALHVAMGVGNEEFVELLIKHGANLHTKSIDGISPFMNAVQSEWDSSSRNKGRARCVELLVQNAGHSEILMGQYFKITGNVKSAINRTYALVKPVIAMFAMEITATENSIDNLDIYQKINSYPELKQHFDFCMGELGKMKNKKIYKNVTPFDVITENDNFKSMKNSTLFKLKSLWIKRTSQKFTSVSVYRECLKNRLSRMAAEITFDDVAFVFILITFIVLLFVVVSITKGIAWFSVFLLGAVILVVGVQSIIS